VTQFLSRGTLPPQEQLLLQDYDLVKNQSTDIQFSLFDKKSHQFIGLVGLHSINWLSRHAEFRILIGEKKFWGKGLGTEACQLCLAYGFEALNMNKIWLGVNTENKKAYESYLKAGFKSEGVLRSELFRNGRYYDIARMSLLLNEYTKQKPKWSVAQWIKKQYPA
jgi:ribosomal-protein-alanine N-acetyltransferase